MYEMKALVEPFLLRQRANALSLTERPNDTEHTQVFGVKGALSALGY